MISGSDQRSSTNPRQFCFDKSDNISLLLSKAYLIHGDHKGIPSQKDVSRSMRETPFRAQSELHFKQIGFKILKDKTPELT